MKTQVLAVALLLSAATGWASDDRRNIRVTARLASESEVPAVSSPGRGSFRAVIDKAASAVRYELSFDDLQADVVMAHIHLAQPNVNGGIMVWLCGTTAAPGPSGTQVCPQSGTISGIIVPADVLAVTPQGIAAGEFDEFVAAVRAGLAYVNVHTTQSPSGEIRGQLKVRD
jgi:hypothetical protein